MVQKLWMGWRDSLGSKITGSIHERFGKMVHPDPISDDTCRQGIAWRCDGSGQFQATTGCFRKGFAVFCRKYFQKLAANLFPSGVGVATNVDLL